MKKVLFLTVHLFMSKRNANFHHLAKACANNGNEITFCTVPNSINTLIQRSDNRKERVKSFYYSLFPKILNNIEITSYISLLYPLNNTPFINGLLNFFFQYGYSSSFKRKFDYIIVENGIPLLLVEKLKKINPNAKFIYRVSDPIKKDVGWKGFLELESKIIEQFDLISTPASLITKKLKEQYPNVKILTHYHGINKKLFLKQYKNPYMEHYGERKNFIFVGASKLDIEFLKIASKISKNYLFHIIGPFNPIIENENIIYYGEMKFEETIKYIQYADVCLQTLIKFPYSKMYERTLKFTQYSFYKKPIIAPKHMELKENNVFTYTNEVTSITIALKDAIAFDMTSYDNSWIKTWEEISMELCQ